ncbi:MAG: BamA/TamA family outer membrane protein [Sporocytophaga sp.]|uniref:BamA/TamA family outer membrane protein n=1 Tax=Sporocytophaga sp. TaxID=2231183 RepID=UPI001B22AD1A|nr:BamA/TamA family outer membrane protein [Sporocytophaga sp.]MBO9701561.1 BamA/TamA family outer membrane protein [Sporocytophaga sp.]
MKIVILQFTFVSINVLKNFLILFVLLFTSLFSYGQRDSTRIFLSVFSENNGLITDHKTSFGDSVSAVYEVKEIIQKLHKQAYLQASVDSLAMYGDTLKSFISLRDQFKWAALKKGNINPLILSKTEFQEKYYRDKLFNIEQFLAFEDDLLTYLEDHGYPFASLRIDSFMIEKNSLYGVLNYDKGPMIVFDSVIIVGSSKVKNRYLMRELHIEKGQPFSQKKVLEADKILSALGFVRISRPPVVEFRSGKATVTIFLEDKKINQADGIIGFLPNEGGGKKLLITGELNLNLKNVFGTGKGVLLEWKKLKASSQTLNIGYYHPKLLGSNLDLRMNFNLLNQDSLFLTVYRGINVSSALSVRSRVSFFTGLKTSRQFSSPVGADTTVLLMSDYNYYNYGLSYNWNNLDDIFYPHKGWIFDVQFSLGNKVLRENSLVKPELYDQLDKKSIQYSCNILINRFFPIRAKSVIFTRFEAGKIFNDKNTLFINDLYRVGGLKSLRGFNELNYYASTFGIASVEYRYFTDPTSYLLVFYDQGYVSNVVNPSIKDDFPFGFGVGVSFTTSAGVFNFVYSLGQSRDQKLSLNLSKVHFGIISRF